MKNFSFILILSTIFCVSITSCQREELGSPKSTKGWTSLIDLFSVENKTTHGIIYLQGTTSSSGDNVYIFGANIFADTPKVVPVDAGSVTIGNKNLNSDGESNTYYYTAFASEDANLSSNFGKSITFGMSGNPGNGIPSFSTSLFVPNEISIYSPSGNSFSKTEDLIIEWNEDPGNTNKVYILLGYNGFASNEKDPSLPEEDFELIYESNDDGSYTIPKSSLNVFPGGGIVRLIVVRGNYRIEEASSKYYECIGYTKAGKELSVY
jgi:hypothetical protein